MVEPPCTTFSPALGTTLALRALTLMWIANQVAAPALLEQPRKTKMRRLSEWEFLVKSGLLEELVTASCMFGSIHLKEFLFLACFLDGQSLCRTCTRDYEHVPIAGKWTKPSATYMDELACTIADAFHCALLQKLRVTLP